MKYQLNLFFLALGFFSRIPIPAWVEYSAERLNQCNRYFALIGWLLGLLVACSYWAASMIVSEQIAVFLAMIVSLLLTGVFHEDGLADTADGFGGGLDKNRKLAIMKDSRLGTYGVTALVMALLGKWLMLSESQHTVVLILVAYPMSRAIAASFISDLEYVTDSDSKSKPLALSQSVPELLILMLTASVALLLLPVTVSLFLVTVLLCGRWFMKRWLITQVGGYTGDNLGAVQQISELLIYFVLLLALG